ncbi:MAG: AraC family transcriptional regulator [Gammaproteobacteria bacterium]|nr:AraC family transcriptional regulator [Gammaproteobacteria bacterium]
MSTLASALGELRRSVSSIEESGLVQTGVPGVSFFWIGESLPRTPLLYEAGIVIIGQGRKVGYLGDRRFVYDKDTCLVLGVPVPFECETHATSLEPMLGVRLDIDLSVLNRLVSQLDGRLDGQIGTDGADELPVQAGVAPVRMQGPLLAAAIRLIQSLADPLDRQVIGVAAVEEILYRVLRGEQGHVLNALTLRYTPYASIAQALNRMHTNYQSTLSVEELARESAMGVSSFHRAFKAVTGDSPVQYLKKIRLLKAKGLLVLERRRVEEAAYAVGYASPSQFSREFKRYFSVPPSAAQTLPYADMA